MGRLVHGTRHLSLLVRICPEEKQASCVFITGSGDINWSTEPNEVEPLTSQRNWEHYERVISRMSAFQKDDSLRKQFGVVDSYLKGQRKDS